MSHYILAIDTSCDDTSAAVISGRTVLSNVVASQTELHKQYGGVFPTVAKQAHRERIQPVTEIALKRASVTKDQLAAVAVTQGPGLAPALEVGVDFAKRLASELELPLIPVNHMEGHVLSVLAQPSPKGEQRATRQEDSSEGGVKLPCLAVVISGGHTEFVLVRQLGDYERVGWTVDDAAGEVLDKFGRMVDLGYPAGPVVEQFAKLGNPNAFRFPLPMTTTGNSLMSFSGLKTAARKKVEELTVHHPLTQQQVCDLCASFQFAVFHAITYKLNKFLLNKKAAADEQPIFGIWLGGGVAANVTLRRMLRKTIEPYGLSLRVPYSKKLCSDNAAMIGVAAGWKLERGEHPPALESVERRPRWQIGEE